MYKFDSGVSAQIRAFGPSLRLLLRQIFRRSHDARYDIRQIGNAPEHTLTTTRTTNTATHKGEHNILHDHQNHLSSFIAAFAFLPKETRQTAHDQVLGEQAWHRLSSSHSGLNWSAFPTRGIQTQTPILLIRRVRNEIYSLLSQRPRPQPSPVLYGQCYCTIEYKLRIIKHRHPRLQRE